MEGDAPPLPWSLSQFAVFQALYVVTQLEGGAQLQTHVLHDHVAPQQHQSFAVDLLRKQTTSKDDQLVVRWRGSEDRGNARHLSSAIT